MDTAASRRPCLVLSSLGLSYVWPPCTAAGAVPHACGQGRTGSATERWWYLSDLRCQYADPPAEYTWKQIYINERGHITPLEHILIQKPNVKWVLKGSKHAQEMHWNSNSANTYSILIEPITGTILLKQPEVKCLAQGHKGISSWLATRRDRDTLIKQYSIAILPCTLMVLDKATLEMGKLVVEHLTSVFQLW